MSKGTDFLSLLKKMWKRHLVATAHMVDVRGCCLDVASVHSAQDSCSRPKPLVTATKIDFNQAVEANQSSARPATWHFYQLRSGWRNVYMLPRSNQWNPVDQGCWHNLQPVEPGDDLSGLQKSFFWANTRHQVMRLVSQKPHVRFDLGLLELTRPMALRLCYCASYNRDGQAWWRLMDGIRHIHHWIVVQYGPWPFNPLSNSHEYQLKLIQHDPTWETWSNMIQPQIGFNSFW